MIGLTEEITGLSSAFIKLVSVKTINVSKQRIVIINPAIKAFFVAGSPVTLAFNILIKRAFL